MNNQPRLSFIVPCYNSEKFISKCLDSLYNQDVPESDYEIICVNDCSPDGTRDIILEYQKRHKNLILLEQPTNQKQGAARNRGIREARGKYVWFVDSDDFIAANCLKNLLEILEKDDLDVLNFDLYDYFSDGTTKLVSISPTTKTTTGAEWLKNLEKNFDENGYPVTKIFRTKFLIDNDLSFPENRYYEDQQFSLFSVYTAQKFKHIQQFVYFYVKRSGSVLNSPLTAFHYVSSMENGADYLNFSAKIKAKDPDFAEKIKMSGLWKVNFGMKDFAYLSSPFRKRADKALQPYLPLVNQSDLQGTTAKYFKNFTFYNRLFLYISPILRFLRNTKRTVKSWKRKLFK